MTTAVPSNQSTAQQPPNSSSAAPDSSSSLSGTVPAQLPVRSYATATATKTATTNSTAPAGGPTPAQNAKGATDSPVNGVGPMAQGVSQPAYNAANGTPAHGRKASLVINQSGATGYAPNGGPVGQPNGRPLIQFGSQASPSTQASAPNPSQNSSLATPSNNPRTLTPAHSPSPIPQPPPSGGRHPPAGLQNQNNGLSFGSHGSELEQQARHGSMPSNLGHGMQSTHERRTSSQNMQNEMGGPAMPGMGRSFAAQNGRGRGYPNQSYPNVMPSPGPNYRALHNNSRGTPMSAQFPGSPMMPNAQYNNRGRNSPAPGQPQTNMPPGPMPGNPPMYHQGFNPSHQQMYPMQPPYDPYSGHYQPYYNYPYPHQPPPSPRPMYPTAFQNQQGGMQPPFNPPNMSRSASHSSDRPPSTLSQSQTSAVPPPQIVSTPSNQQPAAGQSSNFVKPPKRSAIRITDSNGNPINLTKASPSPSVQSQTETPVIVATPHASTPPPRVPSAQHNRADSKPAKSAEETKNAFQEQVKRQAEEDKRRAEESAAAAAKLLQEKDEAEVKAKAEKERSEANDAASEQIKDATANLEKAAAVDAGDKEGEKAAEAVANAVAKDDVEKTKEEETEEERMEREIAEMEAAEREEEEREKAFQEKRQKEKAEADRLKAERADEELKKQEREAEEREEQRERERKAGEATEKDPDQDAKDMFATLKKPTLGPGASAPDSGAQTPASEDAASESSSMPPPSQPASATQARPAAAQKPKPAHLKLETAKRVEPAEPTPGMQALKSARFLQVKEEASYPDGFKSPNPALNLNGSRKGCAYDKDFLLQFQNVFKEKPSVDWDQRVKDTLGPGEEPSSAKPGNSRTPSSTMPRSGSGRPGVQPMSSFNGPMGNFGGGGPGRTLAPGTNSEQRFHASNMAAGRPIGLPMARMGSQLGMGAPGISMARTNSMQAMGNMGPGSQRQPSGRGPKNASKSRNMSKKEADELAAKMPLTAHMEVAPLQKSTVGWKASSVGAPVAPGPDLGGMMPPDMVQRKVKAALNKMTPEKFEKISDQILEIAAQSRNETDGRTLRQVIQLTFEKACDEAHWAGMYAKFCNKMLTTMSTEIRDETIKDKNGNSVVGGALFRKYLLNRCQEEFERGWQVNLPEKPEGESQETVLLSDEYYVAAAAKRRGLGLIQFIGQLYKLRMLTLRIMHECVMKLLNFDGDPDEAAVENLTTLLRAVGATMQDDGVDRQGAAMIDMYFKRIDDVLLKSEALASRPKFMILDLIDLRKSGWRSKEDAKGPKTIQQIHAEADAAAAKAEQDRQRQNQRGGGGGRMPPRGDARNFSGNAQPPVDYNKTNVNVDDLRRLQNRGQRQTGGTMGPGGNLGPGTMLTGRSASKRGPGMGAGSGNSTRTGTPSTDNKDKKEESSAQQNTFSALASLDTEAQDDVRSDAASPPAARAKSPLPSAAAAEATT